MTRQPKSGSPRFTHDDCVRIAGKSHFLSFSEHGAFRFVGLGLDCQLRIRPCCTKLCHKSRGIESRKVLLLLRGLCCGHPTLLGRYRLSVLFYQPIFASSVVGLQRDAFTIPISVVSAFLRWKEPLRGGGMPYPIWSHLAFTIIGGDVGGHEILVLVRPVRDILYFGPGRAITLKRVSHPINSLPKIFASSADAPL